ncbi:hypothetical protein [Nostoc sp. UHCC 0252]|uniref:hypothetical protein n=1 Tax=Nostoc sp. UHCC 0252 TaxID=3110241 RepID=UPI002B2097FB|nr:hypothetical protein [Nostoc sp. UHCC 0252]MEA5603988.1 hypothetical protein [Nostoc sp. UHCC 0252]
MNGEIDLNLTKTKQSSLQTEPNDSETDNTLLEPENDLTQEGGTLLIANGPAMNPPPPKDNISAEPEVNVIGVIG